MSRVLIIAKAEDRSSFLGVSLTPIPYMPRKLNPKLYLSTGIDEFTTVEVCDEYSKPNFSGSQTRSDF